MQETHTTIATCVLQ